MAHKLEQLYNHLTTTTTETKDKIQNPNSIPWDPNNDIFPLRSELPKRIPYHPDVPEDAAWVWGKDDYIGRLNLLTPQRVANAARTEIRTGETVRLDLPLHIPSTPGFNRQSASHRIVALDLDDGLAFDDIIDNLNPQSGSQWDGFRHFAHLKSGFFYNGTKAEDIQSQTDDETLKCSIHHWSSSTNLSSESNETSKRREGISGRAIFLDYWTYAQSTPGKAYDPYTGHSITFTDLQDCARYQGINILPARQGGDVQVGDILLIRFGWVDRYYSLTDAQREKAAKRHVHVFAPPPLPATSSDEQKEEEEEEVQEWAGLAQDPQLLTWLHDSYFSAVAGDAPSFERWPSTAGWLLHEYILSLWGMPLGEMWDLEGVAQICRREKRWTFFLASAPDMVFGGVGSRPNATAIF